MKRFLFTLTVIATIVVLTSCSDDDNNDINGDVVGKWRPIEYVLNGVKQNIPAGEFLELKSDGTLLERTNYEGSKYYYIVGTWQQANGKLELLYDDDKTYKSYPNQGYINFVPITYTINSLTNDRMVLRGEALGFEGIMTYEKM